ncbi:Hypothetical predicted protein [Xyrichtys novacula]|uniref:Uncharacterized protein n=1 Tax=Xyrichtys novacula TaxID=13765 RepID=A0AAV1HQL0_XYRNO|nr:Hypothetical predicted protein [Xyrichtys novacula]
MLTTPDMKALLAQLLGTKMIEEFLHKAKQGWMTNPMIDGSEFNAYCDVMWRVLPDEEWRLKEQKKNIQWKLIQLQLGELLGDNIRHAVQSTNTPTRTPTHTPTTR